MITPDTITKKQAAKLVIMLERWTRCEILARLGGIANLECVDYFTKKIDYENKIRKALFGSDNIVELGKKWDILPRRKNAK